MLQTYCNACQIVIGLNRGIMYHCMAYCACSWLFG